jgi:hypothetical protein
MSSQSRYPSTSSVSWQQHLRQHVIVPAAQCKQIPHWTWHTVQTTAPPWSCTLHISTIFYHQSAMETCCHRNALHHTPSMLEQYTAVTTELHCTLHVTMSRCPVTTLPHYHSNCHVTLEQNCTALPCYTAMLHCHVTLSCYTKENCTTLSCYAVMLQHNCTTLSCYNVMLHCHVALPCYTVLLQ